MPGADLGVFGGSGFYSFLEDVEEVEVETPYGKPSAPLVIGEVGGRRVAFLPRHGRDHELPPHRIPYRANVWAMRELGVRRIIGPYASGALKAELELGEFVVCDQFVDRTYGPRRHVLRRARRRRTSRRPTRTAPTCGACSSRRRASSGSPVRDGGTVVVDPGPALLDARRVEVVPAMGWDMINMTAYPEGYLARELELCYANISMVTDHDVGVEGAEPVTHETVLRGLQREQREAARAAFAAIPKIGPQPEDACATALRARGSERAAVAGADVRGARALPADRSL